MPPEIADLILEELRGLRAEVREISSNGCAHRPAHDRMREDTEQRLRVVERYHQRQTGMLTAAGAIGGVIAAALTWIGRMLLTRIGNG